MQGTGTEPGSHANRAIRPIEHNALLVVFFHDSHFASERGFRVTSMDVPASGSTLPGRICPDCMAPMVLYSEAALAGATDLRPYFDQAGPVVVYVCESCGLIRFYAQAFLK